jgi:hypothetical protein
MSRFAPWLLAAVIPLSVVSALWRTFPMWIAGVVAWIACALLWPRLDATRRRVILIMVACGLAGIMWGHAAGQRGLVAAALAQNIPLIAMLAAVSFLQLISTAHRGDDERLTAGPLALARTLIGVHLFGSVINFSAVAIFADRLARRAGLSLEQAVGLSQAFCVGAFWSPFYGAMAVALTVAPGASLITLMSVGLPLAAAGLMLSWIMLSAPGRGGARDFEGYPLHLQALWVPFVLALCVLVIHHREPRWSVLAVIALLAPTVTAAVLLLVRGRRAPAALARLITVRLPEMAGELSLFLAAGVISAGMMGVIAALDLALPFAHFGPLQAGGVLIVIVLAAWIGLHPIIPVAVIGPWVAPLDPDQTLLAMVFLLAWGLGTVGCPMSGTILALHGRYSIPLASLLRRNRVFGMWMLALCVAAVAGYGALSRQADGARSYDRRGGPGVSFRTPAVPELEYAGRQCGKISGYVQKC